MTERITGHGNAILKELREKAPHGFSAFIAATKDMDEVQHFSASLFGGEALSTDYLRHCFGRGHVLVFGLRFEGAIVACSVVEFNQRQKRLYITEIGVALHQQGMGLARWMMARMEDIGVRFGYRSMTSHVTPGNRLSLVLHTGFGMQEARLVKKYRDDGQDAYYMRKIIG